MKAFKSGAIQAAHNADKGVHLGALLNQIPEWATEAKSYFSLPPTSDNEGIQIVSGSTSTIYGDTLANLPLSDTDFSCEYVCNIGTQTGNNFSVTPSDSDIGLHEITVILKYKGVEYQRKTTHLKVYEKVNFGEKIILCFGDSVMYNYFNYEIAALRSIFTGVNITTIGTKTNHSPDLHDAISGNLYQTFVTSKLYSPFVDDITGVFSISDYFTNNAFPTPNIVYMRCGINDINNYTAAGMTDSNLDTVIGYLNQLIDAFLAYDSNLKIVVGLHSLPTLSAATWDSNYPTTAGKGSNFVENSHRFYTRLIEGYRNPQYNSRVYLCYAGFHMDRHNTTNIHTTSAGNTQLGLAFANSFARLHQLSAELLNEPDFNAQGNWLNNSYWTYSGGEAIYNPPDGTGRGLWQVNILESNKYYELTYEITAAFNYDNSPSASPIYITNTAASTLYLTPTVGTHKVTFKKTGSATTFQIQAKGYGKLGRVSLKKII